jgi:hypothetical protein
MYELTHISDTVDDVYCVYRFRNKKGIEKTIVDTIGRFNYGMKKCTAEQIKEWSKGAK